MWRKRTEQRKKMRRVEGWPGFYINLTYRRRVHIRRRQKGLQLRWRWRSRRKVGERKRMRVEGL